VPDSQIFGIVVFYNAIILKYIIDLRVKFPCRVFLRHYEYKRGMGIRQPPAVAHEQSSAVYIIKAKYFVNR
jgi:hypothetical protein